MCIWARCTGKSKCTNDRVFSPKTVCNNWTVGLTVKAGPTKQPLVREYKKNFPAGKKEGKRKKEKKTLKKPQLCSSWVRFSVWICSPGSKPNVVQALFYRKHLSNQDFVIGPICLTELLITSKLTEICLLSTNYIRA